MAYCLLMGISELWFFLQCCFTISTLFNAIIPWLIAHSNLGFINALLPFAVGHYGQIILGLPSPIHLCGTFLLHPSGILIFSLGHWSQYDHLSIKPQRPTFRSFTSASRHRSDHARPFATAPPSTPPSTAWRTVCFFLLLPLTAALLTAISEATTCSSPSACALRLVALKGHCILETLLLWEHLLRGSSSWHLPALSQKLSLYSPSFLHPRAVIHPKSGLFFCLTHEAVLLSSMSLICGAC